MTARFKQRYVRQLSAMNTEYRVGILLKKINDRKAYKNVNTLLFFALKKIMGYIPANNIENNYIIQH